ncbi:MAG: cysteine hydrolase [Proteobacteria bacterium]|nr:cysteine hydrolase [Pseudomonadota bacterium]
MHDVEIPSYVIERIMAKRGRLEVFDHFEPEKTALLVIDMQNFYVTEVATAQGIVPNINRLAEAVRSSGGKVFWVVMTVSDKAGAPSKWPLYHDYFFTPEKGRNHKESLTEGAEKHELYAELDVKKGDEFAHKTRFSPFVIGASDLHERLQAAGIENLIVTGTATNMCSESTARDAMMLDYKVVMVIDANAARYDEDHLAGLTSFYQSFGDVRTTDKTIKMLSHPNNKA